uniref:DNA mismatch repair proteins mutS family domain-containing protein n=1 Tax=Pinguiococcus pyrenoidosus TaxID=172671 RepID=A0A7R9U8H7_9STRA
MAQVGSFVPADEAHVCVFDSIYTRMGADDDLASGLSTFLMELTTTNRIIRNATKRSLVILDELGRGTSTHDGCALAQAALRYIATKLRPICLFVTHYPQIAQADIPGLESCHMGFLGSSKADGGVASRPSASLEDNEVTLLYKVEAGVAARSYGIHTAGLAGLPLGVLEEAARKAADARSWFEQKVADKL